jgi:predicted DNA-binding transcriptional regulator YafY
MRNGAVIRAIAILRLLESGRPVRLAPLSARFGVHERTIRRDIEALEAAGVPITTKGGSTRWCSGVWWLCR